MPQFKIVLVTFIYPLFRIIIKAKLNRRKVDYKSISEINFRARFSLNKLCINLLFNNREPLRLTVLGQGQGENGEINALSIKMEPDI